MFRALLVPLDGTPSGENALPLALSVARCSRAAVHLMRVHVPTLDLNDQPLVNEERDRRECIEEQAYLDGVAERLAARAAGVVLVPRLVDGTAYDSLAAALEKHADDIHADLFVLSGHIRTGLSRWLFGSVADDLIHQTTRPLLLVPAKEEAEGNAEPVLQHILVALDGSPLAERILEVVLPLTGCMRAALTLLRVVEPAVVPVTDPAFSTSGVETAVIESQQEAARQYLEGLADRLRADAAAPTVRTQVALDAQAAEAILGFLEVAPQSPAGAVDLVALATHARSGLSRLLLGSVAERVARRAPVPLLLQHPEPTRPAD